MDKTEASKRLRKIREQRGYKTARDAARAFGWTVSAYASHENGHRGVPPDEAIKYAKAFGFTLDWLYRGVSTDISLGIAPTPNLAFKSVPRLLWNFIKKYGDLETAMVQATEFASLPESLIVHGSAFTMKIVGDSMLNANSADSFKEGDEIVFSPDAQIKPGDFVLAEIFNEDAVVFRRYMERAAVPGGFTSFELAPLNPAHRTVHVTSPEQARIVAKMTHCIKTYS